MTKVLEIGDNVFAKVRGYRPWPARVEGLIAPASNKMKYKVYFYGTSQIGVCHAKDVYSYEGNKFKYGKISKIKTFNKALVEIEIAQQEGFGEIIKKEPCQEEDTKNQKMSGDAFMIDGLHATMVDAENVLMKVKKEIDVEENIVAVHSTGWSSMRVGSFDVHDTSADKSLTYKVQPEWQTQKQGSTANKLVQHEPGMSKGKSLKCEWCTKEFVNNKRFNKHIQIHRDAHSFACNECGKTFAFRHRLKAHLIVHSAVRPFKCDYCDRTFHKNSNLKSHIRVHWDCLPKDVLAKLPPLFECEYCKRTYLTKKGLLVHIQAHMEVRPFKCTHCKSAFYTTDALRKHLRRHTGDRPYECVHCHKTFTQRFSLQKHIQTFHMHSSVMDLGFSCDFCHKEFSNQLQLLTHLPTHKHELTW